MPPGKNLYFGWWTPNRCRAILRGRFNLKWFRKKLQKSWGVWISPRAPYVVLGPPAVFIIDPVSGKLIKSLFPKSEVDKYGKPLAGIIEETWAEFSRKPK